jgi:Curlin associated repeat.
VRLNQENGSEADILQDGNDNVVSAIGDQSGFATQANSTLTLEQEGNKNWAQVEQTGSSSFINQEGNRNTATVDQQP